MKMYYLQYQGIYKGRKNPYIRFDVKSDGKVFYHDIFKQVIPLSLETARMHWNDLVKNGPWIRWEAIQQHP